MNGSEGSLWWDMEDLNRLHVFFADDEAEGLGGFRDVLVNRPDHPYLAEWWPPGHVLGWDATFVHQWRDFLEAVIEDRPVPDRQASFHDGYRAAVVCEAILTAAEKGGASRSSPSQRRWGLTTTRRERGQMEEAAGSDTGSRVDRGADLAPHAVQARGRRGMALSAPGAPCGVWRRRRRRGAATTTAAATRHRRGGADVLLVTHGETGNVFWAIYRNGIRDASKLYGVTVKDLPLETFAVAGYVDLLNQAIPAKPDGIFATILDQNAVDEPLRDAIDSGIPVIAVNVPDTSPLEERIPYLFYVGGDEEAGGRLTAQRQMQEGAVKHAACIIHEPGHTGLEARCRGYTDELTKAGAKVDKLPSSKDATQATEQIKSYLQKNADVDAIFGVGPQPATFALQALDELGKKGDVKVSAYDMDVDAADRDERRQPDLDDRPAAVPPGLRADPLAQGAHRPRLRDGPGRRHAHRPCARRQVERRQGPEGVKAELPLSRREAMAVTSRASPLARARALAMKLGAPVGGPRSAGC